MRAELMEHYLLKLISVSDNVPERDEALYVCQRVLLN